MKRAIIYARVSTDDQRGNYSIPTQIQACVEYVKQRNYRLVGNRFVDPIKGKDVQESKDAVRVFVDDYTSRELSRPVLDAAFQFAEDVGFDVLIVHALDRLARDPYIRQTLEREFEKRGVRVEYVLGNYDESAEGEVRKDLDATFAKWENAKRVERSLRGKRGKAERGLFVCGKVPFGFQLDKNAPGGLRCVPEQVQTVQLIFDLFVNQQYSLGRLVKYLNNSGVTNHSGTTIWARSSVSRLLRNSLYAGYFYYNKHQRKGKELVKRDKKDWIQITIAPIIGESVFKAAQRLLRDHQKHMRRKTDRFYLVSGMVFCESCERAYSAQAQIAGKNKRVNDARSYRHRIKNGHCLNRSISARVLEDYAWGEIVKLLLHPEILQKGYADSLANEEQKQARNKAHLVTLHDKLAKLEQKRQLLTQAYIDPDIQMSKADYLKEKAGIDEQEADVRRQIEEAEATLGQIALPATLESFERFTTAIRVRLQSGYQPTEQEKRELFEMLHVKVNIPLEGIVQVTGWFDANGIDTPVDSNGKLSIASASCAARLPLPQSRV